MTRFVVLDVETPNHFNDRISAIGITIIDNNKIVDKFYSLVNPETYFDHFNIKLTGIDETKVIKAPNFLSLWKDIEPLLNSGILVAHNARFDLNVLKKCFINYKINWKHNINYLCTVDIGRTILPSTSHKLNILCDYYNIDLSHHLADSDSLACAKILLKYLENDIDINSFIKTFIF